VDVAQLGKELKEHIDCQEEDIPHLEGFVAADLEGDGIGVGVGVLDILHRNVGPQERIVLFNKDACRRTLTTYIP